MAAFFGRPTEPLLKAAFIRRSASGADNRRVSRSVFATQPTAARAPRRRGTWRPVALAMLLAAAWTLPAARAGERHDHERARAAVEAGEVLPLPALLARLQRTHPGQVLELELERDDGRWVYEVKLLQADGRLLKLDLDAATGAVLEARRRKDGPVEPARGTPR